MDTWSSYSMKNLAKQAVVHNILWLLIWWAEMVKLHMNFLENKTFLIGHNMVGDVVSVPI